MQIGDRFGRWQIIDGPDRSAPTRPKWLCHCDCGTDRWVQGAQLKMGRSQSCGCWIKERHTIHGDTVGGKPVRIHNTWSGMVDRCTNPNTLRWKNYGGRGIKVCPEWMDYTKFKAWALSHGYQDDLTIERINNDGNYTPENCIWVPLKDQMRNTSRTRYLTAWGETKAMAAWIDDPRCDLKYTALQLRIHRGWQPEDAIGLPRGAKKPKR